LHVGANKQLALLNGLPAYLPNVNLFVSMCVRKEALASSQIEGTQSTPEDVLNPLLGENANRNAADAAIASKQRNLRLRSKRNCRCATA
jgi:Fic family protein